MASEILSGYVEEVIYRSAAEMRTTCRAEEFWSPCTFTVMKHSAQMGLPSRERKGGPELGF